jgi:hypothetical protein
MTTISAQGLAGLGLMGVAKDNFGRKGTTQAFVVGSPRSRSTWRPAPTRSSTTSRWPTSAPC